MASSKPKLMQQCAGCGFRVRRVWPSVVGCEHCGSIFDLAPREAKLSPTDRLHLSILGHMQLWPKAKVAAAFDVTPKVVDQCMERHPLA